MTKSQLTFRSWWEEPVNYRWLARTLESSAALRRVRFIVGGGGAVMLVIAMLTLLSPTAPRGPVGAIVCEFSAGLAGLWALRWWLLPWPGARESLVWLTATDAAITATALTSPNHLYGVVLAALLVVPGGYVCFHGPRVMSVHAAWTLGSMAAAVVLLVSRVGEPAVGTDYPLAVAVGLIMLLVIAVALVTVQICTWLWRLAALSDPLTTVLNRRGFDYYLTRSADTCPSSRIYIATVDLDRFKAVNDTLGHSIGDQVLQRTAATLRDVAGPDAVVARTGGEEFAVAGRLAGESAAEVGERLRAAVATMSGLPASVTASIGVVITQASSVADRSARRYVMHRSAAMYEAKRLGGNTFAVVDRSGPPPGYGVTGLRSVRATAVD